MIDETKYNLQKSAEGIGPLVPILKDKHGHIIDGFHREEVNPSWPSITVNSVDTELKLELARLATNFCRRTFSESEMKKGISFCLQSGMKPEEIIEQTGISRMTFYRYTPNEMKNQEKSRKISETKLSKSDIARNDVSSDTFSIKNQDTKLPSKTDLVACDNCKKKTYIAKMKHVDLCPQCYEKLKEANR